MIRQMRTAILAVCAAGALVTAGQAQSAPPATPAPAPSAAPGPSAAPAAAPAATPAAGPRIVATDSIRDVGKVSKGEKIKLDFEIKNQGTAELVIQEVRPSCGCTVASFDAKVAPGASGKIHVEVDTADFAGPIAKTITVLSNDVGTPRLTLTVKAKVEPQIDVFPGYARYIYVQGHEPGSIKQWVWSDNYDDFKVLGVTSPYKFIQTTFHEAKPEERRAEVPAAWKQWIVETIIQPDAEVGALREYLVVKTNHPKQTEVRIPITGFVRPVMSVTPYVADFGALQMSESGRDLSLVLVNFGDPAVEVKKVTTEVPGVEATIKPIEAGRRYEIKLALTPKMPKGKIEGVVKIETTSTKTPIVEVPLRGTVS